MGFQRWLRYLVLISCVVSTVLDPTEGKKTSSRRKEEEAGRPNPLNIDSERSKLFEGLQDPETSAQGINPNTVQNPLANQLLYQNQAGLANYGGFGGGLNNGGIGSGIAGGLANLGGGVFSNQGYNNPYLNAYQQNPYLGGLGGAGGFGSIGGIGGLAGLGGYGGIGGGIAPDIYTQGALAAQLYNNPLYGAGSNTLSGAAAGINPLLLRGAQNSQYPVVGGLGAYNNPYLAAQALLSPYSSYNQLNNYPFSSRFGIGAGTGRSGLNRFNSYNSQSGRTGNNNNNDE